MLAPAGKVGSISGVVSAAGGLGGYFPPLVRAPPNDAATHSYSIGLLLLVVTALAALAFTLFVLHGRPRRRSRPPSGPQCPFAPGQPKTR